MGMSEPGVQAWLTKSGTRHLPPVLPSFHFQRGWFRPGCLQRAISYLSFYNLSNAGLILFLLSYRWGNFDRFQYIGKEV